MRVVDTRLPRRRQTDREVSCSPDVQYFFLEYEPILLVIRQPHEKDNAALTFRRVNMEPQDFEHFLRGPSRDGQVKIAD